LDYFKAMGVLTNVSFEEPINTVYILAPTTVGGRIQVIDYGSAQTTDLNTISGSLATVETINAHGSERTSIDGSGSILDLVLDRVFLHADDAVSESISSFKAPGGFIGNSVSLLAAEISGSTYLYVANLTGSGISSYSVDASGSVTFLADYSDTSETYGKGISTMARVTVAGNEYLYSGSSLEHGLDVYSINSNGELSLVESVGPKQLLPVSNISQIVPVVVDGHTYLIVASSGSSSISILEVHPNGGVSVTDHVIDTQNTRFENVTTLRVIQKDGMTFVLASGSDDGISLFVFVPGGKLVYLDTIVDSTTTGLSDISTFEVVQVGDDTQIFITSGSEPGVTVINIDLSSLGSVINSTLEHAEGTENDDLMMIAGNGQLDGGAGNDIICDGGGVNTLTGGSGSDTFVLTEDGNVDTITDFTPGEDRIDLTFIKSYRDISQLDIKYTSDGAVITFGDEILNIHTASGEPLSPSDVENMLRENITRSSVTLGVAAALSQTIVGSDLADNLSGTDEEDLMQGYNGNDTLRGGGGDDVIYGGSGGDTLHGGDGHDKLYGGKNNDTLYGDSGDDYLKGHSGNDHLRGGAGKDLLKGGSGKDLLEGEDGDDVLYGNSGNDKFYGGTGDDKLYGGSGKDKLYGGKGDDYLKGHSGNDYLKGHSGDDYLRGGTGKDLLKGGSGNDRLEGEDGDDILHGNSGNDVFYGGAGNDKLYGGSGADKLYGGKGDDYIKGHSGDDYLKGHSGHDRLRGGSGEDLLKGGSGNDRLEGEDGDDILHGESGDDLLMGGAGDDTFVFVDNWGDDTITDFNVAGNEILDFSDISEIENMSDLTITYGQTDTVIEFGSNSITLEGTTATLQIDDFGF